MAGSGQEYHRRIFPFFLLSLHYISQPYCLHFSISVSISLSLDFLLAFSWSLYYFLGPSLSFFFDFFISLHVSFFSPLTREPFDLSGSFSGSQWDVIHMDQEDFFFTGG